MHLFLIIFNFLYFVSSIATPHIFFNLINFALLCFFTFSLFKKQSLPHGLLYLVSTLVVFIVHLAFSYNQIVSISTHLGVALNLYLAVASGLMVRGAIRVTPRTQRLAMVFFIGLLLFNLATEIFYNFSPNDLFYTHRSFNFIHLVIAFLLTFPRSLNLRNFLFVVGIFIYSLLSKGSTGILLSLILIIICIMKFDRTGANRVLKKLAVPGLVILVFMGANISKIDSGGLGRLNSNLYSVFGVYEGSSEISSKSILERFEMLKNGIEIIFAHPFVGVGLDNSRHWWHSNLYYGFGGDGGKHLHNTYLELLVSVGVPFSLVLLFICYSRFKEKRRIVSGDYDRIISIFGFITLVFMLTNTIYKDVGLIFFVTVILFVPNYLSKDIKS